MNLGWGVRSMLRTSACLARGNINITTYVNWKVAGLMHQRTVLLYLCLFTYPHMRNPKHDQIPFCFSVVEISMHSF